VVTGDVSQVDLPRTQMSGLIDAERVLKRVQGIAITRLTSADVVRHPLVARIVDAYDKTPSNRDDAKAVVEAAEDAIDLVATPIRRTSARSRNGS
ncbi:MAG: PhoH family protein, partial [Polaromonas sp.]